MNLGLAPKTLPIVPEFPSGPDRRLWGLKAYVCGKVCGIPGPHEAVVLSVLSSGRVLCHVYLHGGRFIRKVRVITDPSNVAIRTDHLGEALVHSLYERPSE